MTCDRVLSRIEEYCDGELAPADHGSVEAHIAGCAACSAAVEALGRETALYARYDRGFDPSPNLWKGVLARIEAETPLRPERPNGLARGIAALGAWLSPARLAPMAVAAALVVVGSLAFVALRPSPAPPTVAENPVQPPVAPPQPPIEPGSGVVTPPVIVDVPKRPTPRPQAKPPIVIVKNNQLPAPVVDAERQYLRTIAVLSKDVEHTNGGIDAKLRKPLDDLDRNIVSARQAVEKNPKDTEALLNMLAAYDQKVEVLQSLARFQVSRNR